VYCGVCITDNIHVIVIHVIVDNLQLSSSSAKKSNIV
jgi:hypothetical protein